MKKKREKIQTNYAFRKYKLAIMRQVKLAHTPAEFNDFSCLKMLSVQFNFDVFLQTFCSNVA